MLVEKQCSRCKKVFSASVDSQEVCPTCVANEFAVAEVDKEAVAMRQKRAAKSSDWKFRKGVALGRSAGRLRSSLAFLLFVLCVVFIALINTVEISWLPQFNLTHQLIISVSGAVVASILLLSALRRNKLFIFASVCIILAMGAGIPYLFHLEALIEPEVDDSSVIKQYSKVLSMDDAKVRTFLARKESDKAGEHFCILVLYDGVDSQEKVQQLHRCIASSLTRCLNSGEERNRSASVTSEPYQASAYPNIEARLYFVYNAKKDVVANAGGIKEVLSLFGRITHEHNDSGIYELVVSEDKILGKAEDLEDAVHTESLNYAAANMNLLNCADAIVVKDAAERLDAAYPQLASRSDEVRLCLEKLLKFYWDEEPAAHLALVKAWITYCADQHESKVREAVLSLWQRDMQLWSDVAASLGSPFEGELHNFLNNLIDKSSENTLLMGVLDYLFHHGTAKSLAVLEGYLQSEDEEVKKLAKRAKDAILVRGTAPKH